MPFLQGACSSRWVILAGCLVGRLDCAGRLVVDRLLQNFLGIFPVGSCLDWLVDVRWHWCIGSTPHCTGNTQYCCTGASLLSIPYLRCSTIPGLGPEDLPERVSATSMFVSILLSLFVGLLLGGGDGATYGPTY